MDYHDIRNRYPEYTENEYVTLVIDFSFQAAYRSKWHSTFLSLTVYFLIWASFEQSVCSHWLFQYNSGEQVIDVENPWDDKSMTIWWSFCCSLTVYFIGSAWLFLTQPIKLLQHVKHCHVRNVFHSKSCLDYCLCVSVSNSADFVNNWKIFWGRPGLISRDSIHPTLNGAAFIFTRFNLVPNPWQPRVL